MKSFGSSFFAETREMGVGRVLEIGRSGRTNEGDDGEGDDGTDCFGAANEKSGGSVTAER